MAFTGHRKLLGSYRVPEPVQLAIQEITKLARGWGFDEFRCGMAVGVDMYCASTVIDLEYPLHAYLPFKGYENKWPKAQQNTLQALLAKATKVKYVSEPPFYSWKMILRDKVMVQDTGLVVAVWDGREEGGTYQTLKYAKDMGTPVWHIQPDGKASWL